MNNHKILFTSIITALVLWLVSACTDMNDKHDIYLSQGEQIYIGKVDSINVFPGKDRVKIRYWASDPRCKAVGFFWSPFNDSIFTTINKTAYTDSFDIVIGGETSDKIIKEGSYTFQIFTYDNKGHQSVPFEKIVRVYGDNYQNSLTNRVLLSKMYIAGSETLILRFGQPLSEQDIGVLVSYTDVYGDEHTVTYPNEDLSSTVTITEVPDYEEVFYQTLYIPHPMAIDTFVTAPRAIDLF